ncbi:hypothetical protein Ancab_019920 [Ancistrocladus abbreviatus]
MSSSSSRPIDRNSSKASDHDAACPIANFHPDDVWGDFFLNYTPVHEVTQKLREEEARKLKEHVKRELLEASSDLLKWLNYIDVIQRLGGAYHCEDEIGEALQYIHKSYYVKDKDDLCRTSLLFRLLRQHGLYLSCGK